MPPRPASQTPSASRVSSSSFHGGFTPGAVLVERYRIIGLLGRGGMGEVYRADDLKLGVPVALKFLRPAYERDPAFLERFLSEVRIARQVSHPNVCRVYDVDEADARHFLSMEYVDGEDLATLLRRIGRLSGAKALEIAQQLCAGLAAAHAQGVLHRDLKPSNIMLDGHGRARITDFGLAVPAGDTSAREVSGTPAYMAPEQLAGRGASVQSDFFSLGLVLYEIYTGKRAYAATTIPELRKLHDEMQVAPPSSHAPDIDPAVERAILRCLEKEPARRPASAVQLAGSLPGGDPLAAALAAGETPSPEMVAAAGDEGALAPSRAWPLLAACLLLLAVVVALARISSVIGLAPPEKSPEVLRERARDIVTRFGYSSAPADSAGWFISNMGHLQWRAEKFPSPERLRDLAGIEPMPIEFFYRQGPRPLATIAPSGNVTQSDPPMEISGMASVSVDTRGRLRSFRALAPQYEVAASQALPPDWAVLFSEAGLDIGAFKPTEPKWTPQVPYDVRAAWEGPLGTYKDETCLITAAGWRGRPVWFSISEPWDKPSLQESQPTPLSARIATFASIGLVALLLVGGGYFARRNLKLGRGDRKGGFRIAIVAMLFGILDWALGTHHVADTDVVFGKFMENLGRAVFLGVLLYVIYLALEPFVRRRMPGLLISWSRLLAGGWRDALVGRDLLIGILFGLMMTVASRAVFALPWWMNVPDAVPAVTSRYAMESTLAAVSLVFTALTQGLLNGLAFLGAFFIFRMLLRAKWLAAGVLTLLLTVLFSSDVLNLWLTLGFGASISVLLVVVLLRFGLLAFTVCWCTFFLNSVFYLPLDLSRSYGTNLLLPLGLIIGAALFGFYHALAGRPVFGVALAED